MTETARWTRRNLLRATLGITSAVTSLQRPRRVQAAPSSQVRSLRFALSSSDRTRIMPLLEDYERATGVRIIPITYGDLYRALSVELTRGICSFDIVSIDDPWVAVFAGGRFLLSLDDLGDATGNPLALSDYLPSFLSLGLAPDSTELFALPWIGNIQVFGYDQETFDAADLEPPDTWPASIAAATAITESRAPAVYGFGMRGRPGNSATASFLPFLRGHGGSLFDADWLPQLETDGAAAAMATMLELAELSPGNLVETGHDELAVQVETGKVAQSVDIWPTQLLGWSETGRSEPARRFQIAEPPHIAGARPSPVTGNWLLGIPAACAATAPAALDFIRWLTSPEQQLRLLLEMGLPPTRTSVFQDPAAIAKHSLLPRLAELAAQATPRPRTHFFPAVEQILGYWVAAALAGEVTGDQALSQANTEIVAVMRPRSGGPF